MTECGSNVPVPGETTKQPSRLRQLSRLGLTAVGLAVVGYARKMTLNYYDGFLNYIKNRSELPQPMGEREIDGRLAIGFHFGLDVADGRNKNLGVTRDNIPIVKLDWTVWVDPATETPILIEYESVTAHGVVLGHIIYDISFDVDLDASLFNLDVPPGFEIQEDARQYDRAQSVYRMNDILKACAIYANQHDDQWPDRLDELELEYIDMSRYVYLKPSVPADGQRLVLYEAHDAWQEGINVGFANYRVQFIENEAEFEALLEQR